MWDVLDPGDLRPLAESSDEYDDYVPEILELLNSGATEVELASTLNRIYVDKIGIGGLPAPIQPSARTARALIGLRIG
jgi:hypothetical protein